MEDRKRKVVCSIIIIMGAVTYFLSIFLNQQKVFLDTSVDQELGCTDVLINGSYVQQNFYTDHEMAMALQLCVITWNTKYDQDDLLEISIVDHESKSTIYKKEYSAGSFSDHKLSRHLILEGAHLKSGHWYGIRVESNIREEEKPIAIACVENTLPEITSTLLDNKSMNYNLSLKIWE